MTKWVFSLKNFLRTLKMPYFCRLAITLIYKISTFPLSMLIFMPKGNIILGLLLSICLPGLHYQALTMPYLNFDQAMTKAWTKAWTKALAKALTKVLNKELTKAITKVLTMHWSRLDLDQFSKPGIPSFEVWLPPKFSKIMDSFAIKNS